ncbi:MAG: transcriptional regulator [Candidatus Bathyarchaeota archaeon]|nr:transcriptional regulator [Candidatus Bathyarchaeota archaeon]
MKKTFVKRGRLEIIYEILSVARKPTQKTRILYSCNLSYDQLQKYLKYLGHHSLLSSTDNKGKERFQTTKKGMEFIKGYERLNSFLEEKQNSVIVRNRHNSIYRD